MQYFISVLLSVYYLAIVFLTKLLSSRFSLEQIMINSWVIGTVILLCFYKKDLTLSFDTNYGLLVLYSLVAIFGGYLWCYAVKTKVNMGKIDGLANAIYLPAITVISYYLFNEEINARNLIGIFLVAIGAYLILS